MEQEFRLSSHDDTRRKWWAELNRKPRQIWYVIDVGASNVQDGLVVLFVQRETRANGEPGKIKSLSVDPDSLADLTDPMDRDLLADLHEWSQRTSAARSYYRYYSYSSHRTSECQLPAAAMKQLLPRLCETGRFTWRLGEHESPEDRPALVWDDGPPWRLRIDVSEDAESREWALRGVLFQLDVRKTPYEYLDGRTRKRQEKVERFQTDASCPLFLISLKAGGQGLNLTAADYVFILDPWWNPGVEAQAVDRAHRIGQNRHVFAYRLICRDTVEEHILALQQTKRDLADAIVSADTSLISSLRAEDLQLLLS